MGRRVIFTKAFRWKLINSYLYHVVGVDSSKEHQYGSSLLYPLGTEWHLCCIKTPTLLTSDEEPLLKLSNLQFFEVALACHLMLF